MAEYKTVLRLDSKQYAALKVCLDEAIDSFKEKAERIQNNDVNGIFSTLADKAVEVKELLEKAKMEEV